MSRLLKRLLAGLIPYKPWRRKIRDFSPLITFDRYIKRRGIQASFRDIPIFIISYNRLEGLQLLVARLEEMGYTNLHIIDNNSSYPPLLRYLDETPHTVYRLTQNLGHLVFWKDPQFKEIVHTSFYVVTDPDVIPIKECPDDFLQLFHTILCRYPAVNKVGFSLVLDDIPDHYELKDVAIEWEKRSYAKPFYVDEQIAYRCGSDTTFALYGPQRISPLEHDFFSAIRVGFPYQVRHLPWYKDLRKKTEEDLFYLETCQKNVNTWNGVMDAEGVKSRFKMNREKLS